NGRLLALGIGSLTDWQRTCLGASTRGRHTCPAREPRDRAVWARGGGSGIQSGAKECKLKFVMESGPEVHSGSNAERQNKQGNALRELIEAMERAGRSGDTNTK